MFKHQGLSLLNLLITLALTSILSTIAIPAMGDLLAKNEARATSALIRRSLSVARNLAIINNKDVSVCGLSTHHSCTTTGIETLALFIDTNKNNQFDDSDTLLKLVELDTSAQVTLIASWHRNSIRLKANGNSAAAGSFIYCEKKYPKHARRVTISLSGRSYQGHDKNNDGIVELTNGVNIRC